MTRSLQLYKSMLRQAKLITDYNFRSYAVRKIKVNFRNNAELTGKSEADAITAGEEELEMLTR